MPYMTPSLESQYWTYADSNKEINKSFERLAFLRNRISKGERIERNMLEGFAFKDQKVIWGLEGMYLGQSPKTTMALALEEITNVEMGLVAAATVGAIMILHKIWTWIYKFFNKIFDRNGTASTGDKALAILDNDDEVETTTAKVTNEVGKASHEIKAESDDFEGVDAKYLALASKEGMAAVNKLVQTILDSKELVDKSETVFENVVKVMGIMCGEKTDHGKSFAETPEYKAYLEMLAALKKTKETYKESNDAIKKLIENADKYKKEIASQPGQAFEHLKANATKIRQLGKRILTKEKIEEGKKRLDSIEKTLKSVKKDAEDGGQFLPETTKAMADFIKENTALQHESLGIVVNMCNLVIDNHNALHHLTSKLLSIVKKNDSDNQTLITTLEEGIKTYKKVHETLPT